MDHSLYPTKGLPDNFTSFDLLESAGYIKQISSGFYAFLPLGVELLQNISRAVRKTATHYSFGEVNMPLLQDISLWQQSERIRKYGDSLFTVTNPNGSNFIVGPTYEEAILKLYVKLGLSDESLPWKVFRIGECERNETRPAFGLIRSKSFILADFYVLTANEVSANEAVEELQGIVRQVLNGFGLQFHVAKYLQRNNAWSFWMDSESKQCTPTFCYSCGESYRSFDTLERCPHCNSANLSVHNGIELADVATSYDNISIPLGAKRRNGEHIHLAFAGIGISRLVQILAEQNHDKSGLIWPYDIAPYKTQIVTNKIRKQEAIGVYDLLMKNNIKTILDIRELSMGKKFVDADLVGCPIHIILGTNTATGVTELKNRIDGTKQRIPTMDVPRFIMGGENTV